MSVPFGVARWRPVYVAERSGNDPASVVTARAMADLTALIFDFDGTIAETERDGHRIAYNAAFACAGARFEWDVETYGELLAIAGGKERLDHYIRRERPDIAVDARATLVSLLHETKRRHFDNLADALPFRSGIVRLVEEARSAGLRCAIATTAARSGVDALLRRDPAFARAFEFIAAGDIVRHKKPAPDIYELTLDELGLAPAACIAFEDSALGLRAALAAHVMTLVTPSVYNRHEAFEGAAAVLAHLGEPGDQVRTIAGPPPPRGFVDLAYLRGLHERATAA